MTIRSYDLSIISDQEAADRLGLLAASKEEDLENPILVELLQLERDNVDTPYIFLREPQLGGQWAGRQALDVLALRKAQVALDRRVRGSVHPFFRDVDLNDSAAITAALAAQNKRSWIDGYLKGMQATGAMVDGDFGYGYEDAERAYERAHQKC